MTNSGGCNWHPPLFLADISLAHISYILALCFELDTMKYDFSLLVLTLVS